MLDSQVLRRLLILVGVGQLALALGSLAIPRVLGWKQDTQKLRPLTRQVFWTYAGYIWTTNVCFGLLSTVGPGLLLERGLLAGLVSGYIAAYWAARVVIQFTYFDRSDAPPGPLVRLGEVALVGLFVSCVIVYGLVAARAFGGWS